MLTSQTYPVGSMAKSTGSAAGNAVDSSAAAGTALGSFTLDALSPAARSAEKFAFPAGELPPLRLLVVDDDPSLRKACCEIATGMGFITLAADSVPEALNVLAQQQQVEMLLLDLKIPGGGGLKLLSQVKTLYPKMGVVVMTAFATVSSAVEAMRIGAGDYLTKPFALEDLTAVLDQSRRKLQIDVAGRRLRERLRTERGMGDLIGNSAEMQKVYRILSKVAFSSHPVLVLGESGTGKELVARSIHTSGPNAAKPFIPVDCGSLVPTLIESELFGHVKGAFTGATGRGRVCWLRPTAEPCSSMRSASFRSTCRQSCCVLCRRRRFVRWARRMRCLSRRGLWPRPTAT
jgi:CheY-like chemotaxis protein